jgi:hypothetical protein
MKKILILWLFLLSSPALAWYCNDVASERNGDTINACGIGESGDEDEARKNALNNAYKELDLICSHSSDCANRALEISPLRTECKKVEAIYRCHRGISATVTDKERDPGQKIVPDVVFMPKQIVQVDGREQFIKTSIVNFETNPSDATVYVDGVEICKTPCTQEVNQGEHKILFERTGHDLISKIFLIKEGKQSISENLVSTYGYLTLKNVPKGAMVKIDNIETSARDQIRLRPNEHVVTITSKFHQPWYKKFPIEKGELLQFDFDAESLKAYLKISATDSYNAPIEASIYVNGEKIKDMTPAVIQVPSGQAQIRLAYSGHKDETFELNLGVDEKVELKKKLIPSHEKDWSFLFGIGIGSMPVKNVKEDKEGSFSCCILFDVTLQRTIGKYLAIKFMYNYVSGSVNDNASTVGFENGTPNTTNDFLTDLKGHQIGIALPFYLVKNDHSGFYIGPEIGILKSTLTFRRTVYDNFGSASQYKNAKDESFSQSYTGIVTGIDWMKETSNPVAYGWYLLGGVRKFKDSSKSEVKSTFSNSPTIYTGNTTLYLQTGMIISF